MNSTNILTSFKRRYPWIFKAIILTPPLAFLSLLITGHHAGGIIFLKIIYPYPFIIIGLLHIEDSSTWAIVVYAGFLLYLIFSIVLTFAEKKGNLKKTKIIILIAHVAAAVICMAFL